MSLSTPEQINNLILEKNNILIVLPDNPTTDAVASGLALYSRLLMMKKNAKIVSHSFQLLPNHSFLPRSNEIIGELSSFKKFIITLDVQKSPVEDLSYDISDGKLHIYITPKNGTYEEKDVSNSSGHYPFDLVITLSAFDLNVLGEIFDMNAEFFLQTPIINIDYHSENEKYGSVNHLDLTATSVSEMFFDLFKNDHPSPLDEMTATCLLTGIIANTKSFQKNTVTPKSLAIASQLVHAGARREEIYKNLYQRKSLGQLRLWGAALARIQHDPKLDMVWSVLKPKDFEQSQSSESDLPGVIDELIVNAPEAKTVAIIYSMKGVTWNALLTVPSKIDAISIFSKNNPVAIKNLTSITLPAADFESAKQWAIDALKPHLLHLRASEA